jgi:hypothetical protein
MNDPKVYSPPTLTVIGTLSADTRGDIIETLNNFGKGKTY